MSKEEELIKKFEEIIDKYVAEHTEDEVAALEKKLDEILSRAEKRREEARKAAIPPADRSKRCMLSGEPETPEHREIIPESGMQKDYVVLCPDERAKGFVRPVRKTYIHIGKPPDGEKVEYPYRKIYGNACGTRTTMGLALAETYARDPGFYSGTFCCSCKKHFPLDEFVWEGTTEQLGS